MLNVVPVLKQSGSYLYKWVQRSVFIAYLAQNRQTDKASIYDSVE